MQGSTQDLVLRILDALLAYHAIDPYWLDLPFSQSELTGRYFLNDGSVPAGALEEIAALIEQHRQTSGAAM